jgi:hypothetical protein
MTKHRMHANSLAAFRSSDFNPREQAILRVLREAGIPMSDRAIMQRMGYQEPNAVRPRINHLLDIGALEEAGNIECPVTGKTVRTVRIVAAVQETLTA